MSDSFPPSLDTAKTDNHRKLFCAQGLSAQLLWAIIILYLADQITKWWVVLKFSPPQFFIHNNITHGVTDQVPVIEGFFNIVRVHNTGMAFGIGNGALWSTYVFLAIPIIALIVLIVLFKRGVFSTTTLRLCGMLLIAGILGNLTDRLFQGFFLPHAENFSFWQNLARGYVVDFIDVTIPVIHYRWPSFNIADSCITIAACLLFFQGFSRKK